LDEARRVCGVDDACDNQPVPVLAASRCRLDPGAPVRVRGPQRQSGFADGQPG
jgi:hypothetical protein